LGPVAAVAAGLHHTFSLQATDLCERHISASEVVQAVHHAEPAAWIEAEEAQRTEQELWATRIGYLVALPSSEQTQLGTGQGGAFNLSGMTSRHSTSQGSHRDVKTTASAPVGQDLNHCFLPGACLMGPEGPLQIEDLKKGQQLLALCSEEGFLVPSTIAVKRVDQLPARDRDLVTLSRSDNYASESSAISKELHGTGTFTTTADHLILAHHGEQSLWQPTRGDDVKPGTHQILLADHQGHHIKEVAVARADKAAMHCEVFELELENSAAAVFLAMNCPHGDILAVAVFGSLPRATMICHFKRTFLEIDCASGAGSSADAPKTCKSDPTHTADAPLIPFRTIHPPHSDSCKRGCKYFIRGKCRNGKLCNSCHDEAHLNDPVRVHRGRRRRQQE